VLLTFWGVRGSLPSPGPETVRYGGNTSCVAIQASPEHLLVIDAGSGIRRLSHYVAGTVERIDILLSHLHMDHIQGLGFFAPLYTGDVEIHIWGPRSAHASLGARLTRYLSPPLFPVHLRRLPSTVTVHDVPLGPFRLRDVHVDAALICHPGCTVGYRVVTGDETVAYLSDHEPALAWPERREPEWISGLQLARGADVLVHDCQYDLADYADHVGWGHSAWEHMIEFAHRAGVERLVPFHYDPSYDDDRLDAIFDAGDDLFGPGRVVPAREGMSLRVRP
jgi:phosphoribosyl 1,2-cyclic phosphodiesterase